MHVMEAIRRRHSVRSYQDKEIPQIILDCILEAGRLAPSAKNLQEWRFIVVRNKDTKQKLMKAAKGQAFVGQAPVVIACCAVTDNHMMTCGQLCYPIDLAIAIDHMVLKATEEGLGTCWIGAFFEEEAKKILHIPDNVRIVELLALGYSQEQEPRKKNRLSLREVVMYEGWQ